MQTQAVESVAERTEARAGWLARAILAGFAASVSMLIAFLLAYAVARLAADLVGGGLLDTWLQNLTGNRLIDAALTDVYIATAVYLAGGLIWATLYAAVVEPRLSGPAWRRGVVFSLVPWLVSALVVFPLLGGGVLGLELGAGPLPVLGNLLLHLVYGAVLGHLYGPFGSLDATTLEGRVVKTDAASARGLLIGAVLGTVFGVVSSFAVGAAGALPIPPVAVILASALVGAGLGVVIGSFVGLSSQGESTRP